MTAIADEMKKLELDIKSNPDIELYKERVYDFFKSCQKAIEEINIIEKQI